MGQVYSQAACQYAYQGDMDGLSGVLSAQPAVINLQDDITGDTPLIAACRHSNLSTVRFLLDKGADPGLRNKKHRTCLHYVAKQNLSLLDHLIILILMPVFLMGYFLMLQKQRRNEALMKEVLSTSVDVNALDYEGETPLDIAIRLKFTRLVPMLRKMQ
ncbi:ankyrin repeat domain-containing protein 22 isoform X2 [Nerophis lumbriciformis]|uniref:ankyrin repeat domain-containing protein 22 isoform X2 n=1 Tax=Nerophis lumbriciformis TaxID=546530 RepID=UPI002ADF28A8|nr:ankyrin repeat domain-containing protein 22-like isoform X2 [Nerophis lumbriciformis]